VDRTRASNGRRRDQEPVYKFAPGYCAPVPAQTIGETFERYKDERGEIDFDTLIEDQRPDGAPMHFCLPWDDAECGRQARLAVAKRLAVCYVVVKSAEMPAKEGKRVNVAIGTPLTGSHYVTMAVAMSDKEIRERLLARLESELRGVMERYKKAKEMAAFYEAIEKIRATLDSAEEDAA
jgi:hypothetical protein